MTGSPISQTLTINAASSKTAHHHGVILTVKDCRQGWAQIVFGSPGAINVSKAFELGDAELYETREHGIIEVRLMSSSGVAAELLLTRISPRNGFATAIDASSEENRAFTPDELLRIERSMEEIKAGIAQSGRFSAEQKDYLALKFAEVVAASARLGRKDWIMYVSGTLTSVITSAAFDQEASRALIGAFNRNFDWVFNSILQLIG